MAVPFDKYAARGAYHWHEASRLGVRFNAPLVSRYSSVLKRIPSGANEILDLGCGDGYLTCLIAKSFPQSIVIGLDGDQSGVDTARYFARNVSNARFEFSNNTNNSLPFAERRFDVVVMADVIEHLIDVGGMLSECRRILMPHGSLIVTTPNRQNGSKWDERHIFEFSGQELKTEIAGQFESVELFGSWPMHHFRTWRRKRGGRAFLDFTARLGWNVFDREVRDPDATYGQLLVSARAPENKGGSVAS
jgi:SAM-dependent methyltransferase